MHRVTTEEEHELRASHGLLDLEELDHLVSIEDEFTPEEIIGWSTSDDHLLETLLDPLGFLNA